MKSEVYLHLAARELLANDYNDKIERFVVSDQLPTLIPKSTQEEVTFTWNSIGIFRSHTIGLGFTLFKRMFFFKDHCNKTMFAVSQSGGTQEIEPTSQALECILL